jgi:2-amino-4-hydroxy-6-hydroxymethyldihydropteridine diphosphokinase
MQAAVRQAFVGVGSNLGDRLQTLNEAFRALGRRPEISEIVSSSVYETAPVGVSEPQPLYLNAVFGIETTAGPETFLSVLLEIEQQFGRIRRERWGPRTLDLDLLVFENETRSSDVLQLPHPRMFERGFVTVPFRELLNLPRFQMPRWDALRKRLALAQADETHCRRAYAPLPFTSPAVHDK